MSVAYNVVAAGEVQRYRFAVETLRICAMVPPAPVAPSRNPSPLDLRAVLDDLEGYSIDYVVGAGNWQAEVRATTGLWPFRSGTLISVVDFKGDEALPHLFYFDGGDLSLTLRVVERLSRGCGPLFVFPDTGARPLLVTPGTDPIAAVEEWEVA